MMPNVTSGYNNTTSAKYSKTTILNHKDSYCVGEHLMVRLDMYDHLGKRKEYGGDFLRARIYSLDLKAGASGSIKDFRNGTYLVNFTLFWEGNVRASILLIHPSEGVSALWAARKKGYGKIGFTGKFLNGTSEVTTECGFNLTRNAELCEYLDERDQEAFYCLKPKHVPCDAFVSLQSYNKPISYLTTLEQSLLKRFKTGIEIPQLFGAIQVVQCKGNKTMTSKECCIGVSSPVPSGFVWQNQWHPAFCNMPRFDTLEQINTCLKGKMIYFMGDSTLRQWMEALTKRVTTLEYLDIYPKEKLQKLLAVDLARHIWIQSKKHGHPYVGTHGYTVKDHSYVARDIDNVAGDRDTTIVICLGQHFRPFPIQLFIRRVVNIRRAVQRLLLRSPDMRVIIKGENIREMEVDQERFGDIQGYAQSVALKEVFRDLNVAFIDAWDITVAYNTKKVHPLNHVVWEEVNMFLSYICCNAKANPM
ncbi:NXPE family member 1-like isoform X1 [Sceloporus undulatus]|uniref:NXPE family member 1-like isoform X1 n=1 Tax=Sceloporus undulatus TaxID=8520 RepID=UPI001C4C9B2A|nr:NXPE family member 1-like isoform X1 [Sceloporus undulatus]